MNRDVNILLVEDDPGNAVLVKKSLILAGFENDIQHFENGQDILDFLFDHHNAPNLIMSKYIILLDINMPRINGFDVLKKIKGNETLRTIPVIMLTTSDCDEDVNRCYEHGCNGYIVKPPDLSDVIEKLGGFLQVDCVPSVHLKQDCLQDILIQEVLK